MSIQIGERECKSIAVFVVADTGCETDTSGLLKCSAVALDDLVLCSYGPELCSYGLELCSYGLELCSYGLELCSYSLELCSYGLERIDAILASTQVRKTE